MSSRLETELNPLQFLQLLTEFYCGLTVRKDMQNIACEIREFVMMKNSIANKDIAAKRLLDYFLKLESNFSTKSNAQWDNVFEISTARGYALIRICDFPNRHACLHAFNKIKALEKLATADLTSILSSVQTRGNQYDHIEVQHDIKIKTQYFFKWCQYVQHARMFKELKMRQVENQKISLSFNKYATKFNYFTAWKKLYKKHKAQRQKVRVIEGKRNQRILRTCLSNIEEVAAIIGFEAQLAHKIQEKMLICQKRSVYRKFRANNEFIRQQAGSKRVWNECAYIFIQHFCSQLKPLMNKSYQLSRKTLSLNIDNQLVSKSFIGLKSLYNHTKQNITKVQFQRKATLFAEWRAEFHQTINFNDKNSKLISFLSCRRRRIALTILNFNKIVRSSESQLTNPQNLEEGWISSMNASYMSSKRSIEQKVKKLYIATLRKFQTQLINKLKMMHIQSQNKIENVKKQKGVYLMKLMTRSSSYKQKSRKRKEFYQSLETRYLNNLSKVAFRRWRKLKFYRKYEEERLHSIQRYGRKISLMMYWNKLKCRVQEKQCVTKFVIKVNSVLVKLAYKRIANPSYLINEGVADMRNKKSIKIMKNLFDLLVKNKSYNSEAAMGVLKCNVRRCQKTLMKNLKELYQLKQQTYKVASNQETRQIKKFLSDLKNYNRESKLLEQKCDKLTKKVAIKTLRKSIQQELERQQCIYQKVQKLQLKITELTKLNFINKLKSQQQLTQLFNSKEERIKNKIIRQNILRLKQHMLVIQSHLLLKRKTNNIVEKRICQALKILTLRQKTRKLEEKLKEDRLEQNFKDFRTICVTQRKIRNNLEQITSRINNRNVEQFCRLLVADKEEMDYKLRKVTDLHENNLKQNTKLVFTLLRNNKQNIGNGKKLESVRKQLVLSEFMAAGLKVKFDRIKFNCSLKSYAKNLLKKAFKSLKQTHTKLKQKQNMIKFDKTSSRMVQKSIEKSFKSNTLSEQIQRFNLRKSRQIR